MCVIRDIDENFEKRLSIAYLFYLIFNAFLIRA